MKETENQISQTILYTYVVTVNAAPHVGHDSVRDEQQLDHRGEPARKTSAQHISGHWSTQLKSKTTGYRQFKTWIKQQPIPEVPITKQRNFSYS